MSDSDWVDVPSSSSNNWVDVPSSPYSNATAFQRGSSGVLAGTASLGDMADFGVKYNPITAIPNMAAESLGVPKIGDLLRNSFDYLTGVKDSTKIGEDTLAHKIGSYIPSFLTGAGEGKVLVGGANLAKQGLWDAAKEVAGKFANAAVSGTGGYVGKDIGGVPGEIVGAIGAPLAISGTAKLLAGQLGKSAEGIDRSLVGYDPRAKQKLLGMVDESGNLTKDAAKQVALASKKDLQFQNLQDTGFFDTIGVTDGPEKVAFKLSQFKADNGKAIGNTISELASEESNLSAPWQKQLLHNSKPDFSEATQFAQDAKSVAPSLPKRVRGIVQDWNNSNGTLSDLKQLQEKWGLVHQTSFNPTATQAETLARQVDNMVYGELAGSVKARVDAIASGINRPDLAESFHNANKAYASAATFENSAFNASRQGVKGRLAKDLFSWTGHGAGMTAAAVGAHAIPGVGPILAAERGLTALKDIAPVQMGKLAKGASALSRGVGKLALPVVGAAGAIGLAANKASADDGASTNFTDKFNTKLSPAEEVKFQSWISDQSKKDGKDRSRDLADYDMRGFWKDNNAKQAENGHFPDTYKKPNHPTFSKESIYNGAKLPNGEIAKGGTWQGDNFISSASSDLVDKVIKQESKNNPTAVSSKGAQGTMQLMPRTGKELASQIGETYRPYDPKQNVKLGTIYLNQQLKKYKRADYALAAYNMGPYAFDEAMKGNRKIPSETRQYVRNILGIELRV